VDGAEDVEPACSAGGTYSRRGDTSPGASVSSVAARGAEEGLLMVALGAVGVPDARSAGGM
jgi:hypothetical protein